MAKLNEQEAALFDEPLYAVAAVVREDDSPQQTVVWVERDGDAVSFNTAEGRAKPRHIRRNPNVGVMVMKDPYTWVAVSGPAELTTEGADDQIDRLAKKYLDADTYPYRDPAETRVTVRIKPERVDSSGLNGE
jgi:PPOX class probable F420-dependent enzyme